MVKQSFERARISLVMANQPSVVWKRGEKTATISPGDRVIILDGEDEWFTVDQIGPGVAPLDGLPLLQITGEDGRRFTLGLADIIAVSTRKATP